MLINNADALGPKKPEVEVTEANINTNAQNISSFDVYSSLYTQIYQENQNPLDEEKFAQVMNGELNTNDMLALSVIEIAQMDEDGETISNNEMSLLAQKLEENGFKYAQTEINDYSAQDINEILQAINKYSEYVDSVIAKYYSNKDLSDISDTDIQKALMLEALVNNTNSSIDIINSYFDSEGLIDKGYNFLKELTNLGLSNEDIKEYMANEELKNSILQSALMNGAIEVIDDTKGFSDDELLAQGKISKEKINSIVSEKMANASSVDEIVSYCTQYLKMPEKDVIGTMEEYFSYRETLFLAQNLGITPDDLGDFGIKTKITKGQDGKYYISTDDYRSIFLGQDNIELNEYIKTTPFYNSNKSKGEYYNLSKYIADNSSLKNNYSFEEMYSFLTGVTYNQTKIDEVANLSPAYKQAISTYVEAENLESKFENFKSPTDVVNYYMSSLGCSKDEAIECFNQYYKTNIEQLNNLNEYETQFGKPLSFELSSDGSVLKETYLMNESQYYTLASSGALYGEYDFETGVYTIESSVEVIDSAIENNSEYTDVSNFRNLNQAINSENIISNQAIELFNNSNLAKEYGKFDDVIEKYTTLVNEAYGKNILNEKFALYQNDMDTYSSKIASAIATTGLALSFVAGGSFGLVALCGGFSDNLIDLVNLSTNKKDNELGSWSLQFAKEATAVAIGIGLGAAANKLGDSVCANLIRHNGASYGTARLIGTGVEAVADFALSYPADVLYEAMFTGEFDWQGNLIGNILGSAMDIKGGIGAYRAFKANVGGFDYKFSDGTLLHLDNGGKGYMLHADGSLECMKDFNSKIKAASDYEYMKWYFEHSENPLGQEAYLAQNALKTRYGLETQNGIEQLGDIESFKNLLFDTKYKSKLSTLTMPQLLQAGALLEMGYEPRYAIQFGKLSDTQIANLQALIDMGVPISKAADTAVLMDSNADVINSLINNPKINNYYIADLVMLPKEQFEAAIYAIEQGVSAPSAVKNAKDLATTKNIDTEISKIKSKKMEAEITPEVEKNLEEITAMLSGEYSANIDTLKAFYEATLVDGGSELKETYADFSSRAKSDDSILAKLKAKYESGQLTLSGDIAKDLDAARKSVTDAYGARVQLRSLTGDDVANALSQNGFISPSSRDGLNNVIQKILKNETLDPSEKEYLKVINTLKEKQNAPVFEALKQEIIHGMQINEINNYGNILTSYFTENQIAQLVDLYSDKHNGLLLKVVTQDSDKIKQTVKVDQLALATGKFSLSDGTIADDMGKVFTSKGAIKNSGYCSTQLTLVQILGNNTLGYSEFQIRGSALNKFADVEHIPYDIRKGKITGKDTEYADVYQAIKTMSEDSFNQYNQYLTSIYETLRLVELGIYPEGTPMPELGTLKLSYNDGSLLEADVLKKLSYSGLLQYGHE